MVAAGPPAQLAWLRRAVGASYATIAVCLIVVYANADALWAMTEYNSSPIDWCEDNYEKSDYIVEFYNSLSSIPISLMAPLIYYRDKIPQRLWIESAKIYIILLFIVLIGIGSTYFHGTLSILGQIADEIPIIYIVLYGGILVLPKDRFRRLSAAAFLPPVVIAFVFASTLLALFSPILSHVFVLLSAPFGVYNFDRALKRSKNEAAKRRFSLGWKFFIAAWTCWLIDKFACTQMKWIGDVTGFRPQLHAMWHLLISVVTFLCVGVALEFREENLFGTSTSGSQQPRFQQIV